MEVDVDITGHGPITLRDGSWIGRSPRGDVQLNDPGISEMHAMVSHRDPDVRLLGLRGRFIVDSAPVADVALEVGMQVRLSATIVMEVMAIRRPQAVLALRSSAGLHRLAGVTSVLPGSPRQVRAGWHPRAEFWVWPSGDGWFWGRDKPAPVVPGLRLGCGTLVAELTPLYQTLETNAALAIGPDLTIETFFDTVHVHRSTQATVAISGRGARVISELAATRCPVGWESLAAKFWPDASSMQQRKRWDAVLYRLRRQLAEAGVRSDLLRADGTGLLELVLHPGDRVIDRQ